MSEKQKRADRFLEWWAERRGSLPFCFSEDELEALVWEAFLVGRNRRTQDTKKTSRENRPRRNCHRCGVTFYAKRQGQKFHDDNCERKWNEEYAAKKATEQYSKGLRKRRTESGQAPTGWGVDRNAATYRRGGGR